MAGSGGVVVRVEHAVRDYDRWKREGFDRDPIGRARGGVRRYRVLRAVDQPALVAVELEFADRAAAESFATALTEMWTRVRERFGWQELPQARLFHLTESSEY
jgi:hypothetical protein